MSSGLSCPMSRDCSTYKYNTEIRMQSGTMFTFKIYLFVDWGSSDNVFSVLHIDWKIANN